MSLLDNFPHTCDVYRRTRARDNMGGSRDTLVLIERAKVCWEQGATSREILAYDKRNISISSKFFFTSDPQLNERNVIKRGGRTMEVRAIKSPDASAGLGVIWRVMVEEVTGIDD